MKAFILAAGLGTRLGSLTKKIPKCLVPIGGEPLLGIWLRLCEKYGITDVLINLHHLAGVVEDYLEKFSGNLKIMTSHEGRLLGSAGTVLANRRFVQGEESFFIFYADNLTNINLDRMKSFHNDRRCPLTMGLFHASRPEECGIATIGENDIIVDFTEKPQKPTSDLANAGIYIARQELFDYIPQKESSDFGFDVLPNLVGRMYGYIINEYLIDIGTTDSLERARKEWKGL